MKYVYETEDGSQYTVDQSMKDDPFQTWGQLSPLLEDAPNHPEDSPVHRVVTGGTGFIWSF